MGIKEDLEVLKSFAKYFPQRLRANETRIIQNATKAQTEAKPEGKVEEAGGEGKLSINELRERVRQKILELRAGKGSKKKGKGDQQKRKKVTKEKRKKQGNDEEKEGKALNRRSNAIRKGQKPAKNQQQKSSKIKKEKS
eukprot:TRINITY_DN8620_c0_g1_i3.p1 TRINITY_DN8620_c0_g1~~TRINITY_DN8620_c0_g1_i3.p1  ORF type:complete len:139 (-),score=42.69 TRINITY_DN8620_c0_g1_i3:146-562(-)